MRNPGWRIVLYAVALGLGVFLAIVGFFFLSSEYKPHASNPAEEVTPVAPYREAGSSGNSPEISFIDNPSATCYLARPHSGVCFIEWNYLYVSASTSQYIISMTVEIDGHLRAYHAGFFQTYMLIPGDFYGSGFQVVCGKPENAELPGMGKSYGYTIRARETGGLGSANYGQVICPADEVKLFLPAVTK